MGFRKWLMKQQWRMVQIRGIWSVFYGILLLAYAYYNYIPYFYEMGALGPFMMSAAILIIFLISGYLYDRVFMMWAPAIEVATERNPFQYIPAPYDRVFWLPVYSTLLDTCEQIGEKLDVDVTAVKDTRSYYASLQDLRVERREDIGKAIELNDSFIRAHPFRAAIADGESDTETAND